MSDLTKRRVDSLLVDSVDFHQRGIKNAIPGVDPYDYIVLKQLRDVQNLLQAEIDAIQIRLPLWSVQTQLETPTITGATIITPKQVIIPANSVIQLIAGRAACAVAPGGGIFENDWEVSTDEGVTYKSVFHSNKCQILSGKFFGSQANLAILTLKDTTLIRYKVLSVNGATNVDINLYGILIKGGGGNQFS